MNVGSKCPIAWNHSRHASSWPCYVHCRIAETGSPGIICIICHQVCRNPSDHGIGSMGNHLLSKAHIAKFNKLTQSEIIELTSSMVDETAWAILNRQGSQGITIVSLQRKIIFDIKVNPYWLKWQTKQSKLAAKDFETSKFHQNMWNYYLILGFVLIHIPWNAISNLQLQRSYEAVRSGLVLPLAMTLSNRNQRDYTLSV